MSWEATVPLLASIVTGIVSIGVTWFLTKKGQATTITTLTEQLESLRAQHADLRERNQELTAKEKQLEGTARRCEEVCAENETLKKSVSDLDTRLKEAEPRARKYIAVRDRLQQSAVVKSFEQPVILVGPRAVGKTSLLMQWHAPWDSSPVDPTALHHISRVPVYDFREKNREPHFADPDITVVRQTHLLLRVHDFPGELTAQKKICEIAVHETRDLREKAGGNLGLVLVCMFDAEEASRGLSKVTTAYYNGDLFKQLRSLVSRDRIDIDRLLLVFNKYDLLRRHIPDQNDDDLMRLCVARFEPCFGLLREAVNSEKVFEVFTVLAREEMHFNCGGAPSVLGEAARAFVKALAGDHAAAQIGKITATSIAAERFL